jgi:hypothetical protein
MLRKLKSSILGRSPLRLSGGRPHFRSISLEPLEDRTLLSAAAIIAENALQGTSSDEWDISGAGSANIQGFAAQFSVNVGERVDFKIDTDSDDYRIDVYRMGYYNDLGARKVATINPNATLANNQPDPLKDFQTGLVDAGNWRVSASWNVPTTAVSGVYIAKLTREDGVFGESHIIFVVRDDNSHSDLLYQTSDTTWEAYNDYGGSDLYDSSYLPMGRAYEVSYNRPFTTRDNATLTYFFGSEYPMIRFLEANGYDVSYSSGIDTDRRGAELLEHKVFVTAGHDEYWSGQQRANVEAARDAGVDLAFFSGNNTFWKTRWDNSIDGSNTPYTTLVVYKETLANAKIDPLPGVWTGTWRDPRFSPPADGGRPENALTGTLFTVNGDGSVGLSMNVGAVEGKMRFWRNTSVANLTGNQTATLGDHVLGYEWNEDIDNGFRPAGLFHLSETTANVNAYIQDYGSTYAKGTATHSMTLYRAASGALVFSAGTVQFSWGLDGHHDSLASTPDRDMQQATINLFADMGAQPGRLMSGLVAAAMSTDFTAPFSTITSPANGVTLTAGTAVTIRGTAQEQGGGRVSGVEVSVDGGTTWHPASGLESWTYTWTPRSSGTVTIKSRAIDDSGNLETPSAGVTINPAQNPGVFSFWDSGATPAVVDSGDGQTAELGVRFHVDVDGFVTSLKFYKASANTGTHVARLWTNTGTLLATATFTGESGSGWQTVNFSAPVPVSAGTTYVASYTAPNGHYSVTRSYFSTAGVDNGPLHAMSQGPAGPNGVYIYSAGAFPTQSYQSSNYWIDVVVNTAIAADTTAPTVTKFGQAGGYTVVNTTSAFTIEFSEALNAATVNSLTVTMVRPDDSKVPANCHATPGGWCSGCPLVNAVNNTTIAAAISYDAVARTATITPNSPLDPSTVYTIVVSAGGVKDLAGNALAVDTWSSFYTSNQPPPVLSSFWGSGVSPSILDSGDNQAAELGLKFTADTDGLISGARFYKGSANTGTHTASLWTSGGQRLATATFTNETGSGWQQVNFSAPVAITAGTTYVVSYHASGGHYSVSRSYFGSQFEAGPLNALANGGVYSYGTNSALPTNSYQASNYFVDVVFSTSPAGDTVAPTITNFTPFDGTTNVPVNPTVTINFSEDLDATTVNTSTVKLLDGNSNAVPATFVYNAATRSATLTPTSALANAMNYTIFALGGSAGIRDLAGNPMALNTVSSFTTAVGSVQDQTPPTITAFSPLNGATSVDVNPTLTVTFSEPLNAATVKSNTIYLLKGGNTLVPTTLTYNAATRTATLTPTAALLNSTSYTIYVIGGMTGIKDLSDNALAQNVTSVFQTADASGSGTDTTAPTITSLVPANGATNVAVGAPVTVTFNETMTASTITASTILLRTANGVQVAATIAYNGATNTATLTPSSPLAYSSTYTATIRGGFPGVKDLAGNAMALDATATFTTAPAPDVAPPTVTALSPTNGTANVATSVTPTVTFSETMTASTVNTGTVFLQNASGAVVTSSVAYNATTNTATLTPTSALANATTYTIVVKSGTAGVKDAAGNALAADVTASFTTVAAAPAPVSLWSNSPTPTIVDSGDKQAVELGTKFTSDVNGQITGLRFYKSAGNTGTHTAHLWNASGQLLATATFTSETSSGWQQVTFATPVTIAAGTTYVASYYTTVGRYSVNRSYFNSQYNSGSLHVPTNGGVYRYGASAMPNQTYQGSNYWVDVLLSTTTQADVTPPTVVAFNPAVGAVNVATNAAATITFSEAMTASTINSTTVTLMDGSATVAASVAYNAATNTATLTPTSLLSNSKTYSLVVLGGASGVKDLAGNALAGNATSSFTTAAAADVTPPTITTVNPASGATNVATSVTPTVTFSETMTASTINSTTITLMDGSTTVAASVAYNAANNTATLTPSSALSNSKTYSLVVKGGASGVKDAAGNALAANVTVSFTTAAPPADVTPPTVTALSPTNGATSVAISVKPTVTFSEAMTASTITTSTVFLRSASGTTVAGTVAYSAATNTVTITPTSSLSNSTSYTIVVKGGASGVKDAAGNALVADVTASFTTVVASTTPVSLWNNSPTPAIIDSGDNQAVELGTKFTSDVNGQITGLRFYKAAANTGTHTAHLWTASGQLLATATFTGETASGWQTVMFATPVTITAGTTYVASYYTTAGRYSVNRQFFSSQFNSGSLHVPVNGGVYKYGASGMPTQTYQSSNYWVDVLFVAGA